MERNKDNLSPEQISGLASKVGKMYLEQHKSDEDIAEELGLHPHTVTRLRKLMGLTGRIRDIRVNKRKVVWDKAHGVFKLNAIPLSSVMNELGLESGGAYSWRAIEVSRGKLVLGFEERR